MGLGIIKDVAFLVAKLALQGQTNFAKMLWKFNKVYNPKRQYSDHFQEIKYQIRLPEQTGRRPPGDAMYIHAPKVGRAGAASATAAQE
jgi:magnesium-protoporphyrin IX monomethyl ester (oxidative) cyclase